MNRIVQEDIELFRNVMNNFFENIYYSCFDILGDGSSTSSSPQKPLSHLDSSHEALLLAEEFTLFSEKICLLKYRLFFCSGLASARDGESSPNIAQYKEKILSQFYVSSGYLFLKDKIDTLYCSLSSLLSEDEMEQLVEYAHQRRFHQPQLEDFMFEKGYSWGCFFREIYGDAPHGSGDFTQEELLELIL